MAEQFLAPTMTGVSIERVIGHAWVRPGWYDPEGYPGYVAVRTLAGETVLLAEVLETVQGERVGRVRYRAVRTDCLPGIGKGE